MTIKYFSLKEIKELSSKPFYSLKYTALGRYGFISVYFGGRLLGWSREFGPTSKSFTNAALKLWRSLND